MPAVALCCCLLVAPAKTKQKQKQERMETATKVSWKPVSSFLLFVSYLLKIKNDFFLKYKNNKTLYFGGKVA